MKLFHWEIICCRWTCMWNYDSIYCCVKRREKHHGFLRPAPFHLTPLPQLSHPACLPHLPVTGTLNKEKQKGLLIHSETWDISQTLNNILISSPCFPCWRWLLRQECFWSKTKNITSVGNNRGETWWNRSSKLVFPSETPMEKRRVSELPQSNSPLHIALLTSLNKERWEMCFWLSPISPILFVCFASTCVFKSFHLPGRLQGCITCRNVSPLLQVSAGLEAGFTSVHVPATFSKDQGKRGKKSKASNWDGAAAFSEVKFKYVRCPCLWLELGDLQGSFQPNPFYGSINSGYPEAAERVV